MCGLLLYIRLINGKEDGHDSLFNSLLTSVTPRGPDSLRTHRSHVLLPTGETLEVKLAASVLGLRGEGTTAQPVEGVRGVLGWNGQVFQGLDVSTGENDTAKLFDQLERGAEPQSLLSSIEGPYAFIYLDNLTHTVHFQIDPLSRRSLLVYPLDGPTSDRFILCSAKCGSTETLSMRAMDGGEGGQIRLDKVAVTNRKELDFSQAFTTMSLATSTVHNAWTRVSPIDSSLPPSGKLLSPESEVEDFTKKLTASILRRVENIPPLPGHPRLAILFSGGVDCTLLAALAHRCLPEDEPIDLINVAFQRAPSASSTEEDYRVPDRISGLEATEELRECCSGREWRFVEVNIPYDECLAHRQEIVDLMYPSVTEMDLSLAFPLYFASRGIGTMQATSSRPKLPYTVKAKVYLSGLGADEQLAGYARHRNAFRKSSWPGLISELQLDISRLPTRNLSRDDRIISSHARDARFPYLDLTFIAYLSSLPVWLKCDLTQDGGDKLLLRLSAKRCGLHQTSARVKRAMQFGTRSAKVGGAGKGAKKGDLRVQDKVGLD